MNDFARPAHYGGDANPYEPRKIIRHYELSFNPGTALKHILRAGKKPGNSMLMDLVKARQYLDFEIEALQAEEAETKDPDT